MAGDFLKLVSGKLKEASAIATSAGGGDAGKVIKTNGSGLLDSTFVPDISATYIPQSYLDTDGTLSANSDTKIASQKATKTYVDGIIAAQDAMVFKGVTDCSGNPNYPAANRGDTYRVSVAGKIGGASGVVVEVGDIFICLDDSTSSGNQATVGSHWGVIQTNIDGAVVGPASVTDGHFAQFDGTSGKLIKGGIALDTDTSLAADSASKVPTQHAVKTYVDDAIAGVSGASFTKSVTLSEDVVDGALVNIHVSSGTKARNADADSNAKQAHGYVLTGNTSGNAVDVYFGGVNSALSGLTPGATYWLSQTAGAVTATPPTGTGVISQQVGVAASATELVFEPFGTMVEQV